MSAGEIFLELACQAALALLSLAFLLTIVRVVRGPTLPDRVIGLDTLVMIGIGFIVVLGVKTGISVYVDVAIALGLVGFLATVAFARFVLGRGTQSTAGPEADSREVRP